MNRLLSHLKRRLRQACHSAISAGEVALWVIGLAFLVIAGLHVFFLGCIGLIAILGHAFGFGR